MIDTQKLLDQIDAQAAEIEGLRAHVALLKACLEQDSRAADAQAAEIERLRADRDSWADQASDRLRDWDEMRADRDRLHEALRWAAAALQEACRRSTLVTEKDLWLIGPDARTTAEILDAADVALQGESQS